MTTAQRADPLPANTDAEKTILGAVLLDNAAHAECVGLGLSAADFSLDSNCRIWRHMTAMLKDGRAVDIVTLCEELEQRKEIGTVGGRAYLFALTEGLPRRPVIAEYIRIVKEKTQTRELLSLTNGITARIDAGNTSNEIKAWARSTLEETAKPADGYSLFPIGELLSRPDVPPDYLVDGLLVRGTVSVAVAKPKVGKSTFARGLCLAVAKGEPFLGRNTRQGSCIYLALEERCEEVTSDFRAMGAEANDPIEIHAAAAPVEAIFALIDLVRRQRPALVVIDPLFRLAHIRDEKAYAETYTALGPLIDLARETGTHILLTHHSGKSVKVDTIDSPLGSTAIAGAAATVIVLCKRESYRTLQTVTRIGPTIEETVLTFDADTRLLSIGRTRAEADSAALEKEIAEYLQSAGEKTEPEINEEVEGRTTTKRKALRALVKKGVIERSGTGKSGSPFKYLFSCSPYIPGTREQDIENGSQTRAGIDKSLVPENRESECLVPDLFSAPAEPGKAPEVAQPDTLPKDATNTEVWL